MGMEGMANEGEADSGFVFFGDDLEGRADSARGSESALLELSVDVVGSRGGGERYARRDAVDRRRERSDLPSPPASSSTLALFSRRSSTDSTPPSCTTTKAGEGRPRLPSLACRSHVDLGDRPFLPTSTSAISEF